jgi:hypothetical protein
VLAGVGIADVLGGQGERRGGQQERSDQRDMPSRPLGDGAWIHGFMDVHSFWPSLADAVSVMR